MPGLDEFQLINADTPEVEASTTQVGNASTHEVAIVTIVSCLEGNHLSVPGLLQARKRGKRVGKNPLRVLSSRILHFKKKK